jgi:hypothetical protein
MTRRAPTLSNMPSERQRRERTCIVFGRTIKLAREGVAQPVAGSGVPPRLRGLNRKPPDADEELSYLVLGFR